MLYILKKPKVTEKTSALQGSENTYVFEVDLKSKKTEIKKAVEQSFNAKVHSVRTSIFRTKARRNRYGKGKVSYKKKAFIRLMPGEKISLFEGA